VNSPTGGPELAQIVTVRDIGEEAQIAHPELTDQARAIVGHELVFTAIHGTASCRGGSACTGRPGMVVYNITSQDMNWPEELSPGDGRAQLLAGIPAVLVAAGAACPLRWLSARTPGTKVLLLPRLQSPF
jgi:hypothetical protein